MEKNELKGRNKLFTWVKKEFTNKQEQKSPSTIDEQVKIPETTGKVSYHRPPLTYPFFLSFHLLQS